MSYRREMMFACEEGTKREMRDESLPMLISSYALADSDQAQHRSSSDKRQHFTYSLICLNSTQLVCVPIGRTFDLSQRKYDEIET